MKTKAIMSTLLCVFYISIFITISAVQAQGSIIEPEGAISELWVARYAGPGGVYPGYENWNDRASALAVDGLGNVYVTGWSWSQTGYYDYLTVKYDAYGNQQWAARYDGPGIGHDYARALAVDGLGNVYVTGESEADYATIKYDADGNQQWIRRYDGPKSGWDFASDLAVDSLGNVYVTGESYYDYLTIKYDTNGNQQWIAIYNHGDDTAVAITVDSADNIYVTGSSSSMLSYDYATVKYDTDGNQQWIARYSGPGTPYRNIPADLIVDSAGNIYVTGYNQIGLSLDYLTVKYDADGNQQWGAIYNGPANSHDRAFGVAVDSLGSAYVTGFSRGLGTELDYATVKYDTDGNQQWIARYNGPANGNDRAYAIAVDSADNIYVTGSSPGPGTSGDYTTIIYDSDGNEKCLAIYDGPLSRGDTAVAITVDSAGNIYVTGESQGYKYIDYDYATVKYGLFIPDSVSIGDNVQLGQFVSIGEDVTIGDDVVIGDWVVINENVEIEDSAQIGSDVIIGEDVKIGSDAVIGDGVEIGLGTVIKDGAQIGSDVIIGENVKIGKDAIIGEDSKIGNNVQIDNGQVVLPDSTIP